MAQAIVVFGASGDLAKLKIYPALYELYSQNFLETSFNLVGYARSQMETSVFLDIVRKSVLSKTDLSLINNSLDKFLAQTSYISGSYSNSEDLKKLFSLLETQNPDFKKNSGKNSQVVCYFSVPPQVFGNLIESLQVFNDQYNLKIVIEKPFGTDEASARQLHNQITQYFNEEQFYLLDHYLGKIAVQDILALRQQNSMLNLLLKGPNIKCIQISALETVGVEDRLGYFDVAGTTRDMIQSHLLQILALISMDLPINNESVAREKEHILASTRFEPAEKNLLLGQYEDYKNQSPEVENSNTETYSAVKLNIDREEWYNTPIYLRTGKKLNQKKSQIVIEFLNLPTQNPHTPTNKLVIEFAPNESLSMHLSHTFGKIETTENIACSGPGCLGDYSSLFNDVFLGKKLHFVTFNQILNCWRITDSILKFKNEHQNILKTYKGNQNPEFENDIFEDGGRWF